MLETKIFSESPFKALKILLVILGPIFLLFAILVSIDEMPQITPNGLNNSANLLVIFFLVFGAFVLLTFLILSFQKRKTLKCDFEGCEILERNAWQDVGFLTKFKWSDVKDTNIIENDAEVSEGVVTIYTFTAETQNGQINLLDLKTSNKQNIEGLINYFNKATPHLKYIWVKDKNVGNRQAIFSTYGYTKVVR